MFFQSQEIKPFSIRKEIFSQYRLPDDPIKIQQRKQLSKDKKSSNQVLLRQIGLFKFNVSAVLSQKNDLLNKLQRFDENIRKVYQFIAEYNEGDITESQQIERKFKGIQMVKKQSEIMQNPRSSVIRKSKIEMQKFDQSQYLMKALIIYKGLLNYGQSLKFQGESFRLGTLSNFNPKFTQVKFTKAPSQSENAVMNYITKIIEQSSRAMESKVRYENNYEKDRFLLEEDKYSNSWKSLEELYSPKQVELINFEMLNILDSFDKEFDRFRQTLRSHGDNCKKYQGVMDSMDLMGRQIQEMTHTVKSRDEIIQNFVSLSQRDPQQMQRALLKCEKQQNVIQKNVKIYHINEKLFASYNTQTNLKQYSKQRNIYSTKLIDLQNRLAKWNGEYATLKQIVENYNAADDIINKRIINPKRIGLSKSSSEFDKILLRIEQTNTRKNKPLIILKNNIVSYLQQKATNPNSKNTLSSVRRISGKDENYPEDEILQRQRSFLSNLQRTSDSQKKRFLLQNHEKIKEYMEYNRRKRQDKNLNSSMKDRYKVFEGRLSVLNQITKTISQIRKMQISRQLDRQRQSDSFQKFISQHLTTLQKQINSYFSQKNLTQNEVIYQHIYDYSLFEYLFQSETWFQMTRVCQKLQGSFISRPVSFSSNTNIQALKQLISFTKAFIKQKYPQLTVNMLDIFSQTLFQLTNGLSTELYYFEDFYWQKMTSTVTIFYEKNNYEFEQNPSRDKTIDKSSFFSLPYLIHLNRTSNKNKVLNLDQILTRIVKMMYDQFSNLRQYEIFQYAVCLTYLMKYVRNVCSQDQVRIKILILTKLRRLLTSYLLKSQFMRFYETEQRNNKEISNKMIETILGLQGYLSFNDNSTSQRDKISQFQIENNKYLKGIEQEMKVLVINLSGPYSTQFNLQKIKLFWTFEQWLINFRDFLTNSDSVRSISMASYLLNLRNEIQNISKLTQSIDWKTIKQSDGFLIRMIRKENFYLKKQFNKFKTLQKQNIWKQFEELLDRLIHELESQNSLRNSVKKQTINILNQLELKKNKALALTEKRQP